MTITTNPDFAAVVQNSILTASGNVLANDTGTGLTVDTFDPSAPFVMLFGGYGFVTLSQDGSYVYKLMNDSEAVQSLQPGETVTEQYDYRVIDGTGAEAMSSLLVTITGSDGAPVAVNDAASVQEDETAQVIGNVLANDAGMGLTVQNPG